MMKKVNVVSPESLDFAKKVGQALKRAAKQARRTAKMHGTKLYFEIDGKIVAEKP